jgi:mannose-6-phosphate isomerase
MLKGVCEAMLKASEETVAQAGESLQKLPKEKFGKDSYIPDLLPRLWEQYDKTVGGIVSHRLHKHTDKTTG